MTLEERQKLKIKKNEKREKYESKNCGNFDLIFPSEDAVLMEKYDRFKETAKILINEQ